MPEKMRQTWIDIYKGIAIIFVVIGHLEISKPLYDFIFMFHMYAFFFISGITFKVKSDSTFKTYFIYNIKRLYIPYLFFFFFLDITNFVAQAYINRNIQVSLIGTIKNIISVLIGGGIFQSSASIGAAWFLLALIIVRLVSWLIVKYSHNKMWIFGIISFVLFTVGYLFNGHSFLPFKVFSTLTAFLFMFLGYFSKQYFYKILHVKKVFVLMASLIGFLAVLILSFASKETVVLVSNILPKNPLITLSAGFMGCFAILFLSIWISENSKTAKILSFYGLNSMIIMGIHSEINFVCRLAFDLIHNIINISQGVRSVLILIITLLISIPVCSLLNKYIPILVGKRKDK